MHTPPLDLPDDSTCLDCAGKGWLHMTSGLYGRQIERCDSCRVFGMDEEAEAVHNQVCGCSWTGSEEDEMDS